MRIHEERKSARGTEGREREKEMKREYEREGVLVLWNFGKFEGEREREKMREKVKEK